ncbi:MAG TPA: CsgG/HfaB family protein [Longimicrobiales bacterium]|nr:CsgG/HfaB family protein [Longimicrobiales bacterium]
MTRTRIRRAILLVAALGAVLPAGRAAAQDAKVRVAVLGIENNSGFTQWGEKLGGAAADELANQLVKSGAFSVIERNKINDILAEQHAAMSGALDPRDAAKIGRILGAQVVVVGSITQFAVDTKRAGIGRLGVAAAYAEAQSKLDIRLVNTTTAEILLVADGDGKKRFGGAAYRDIDMSRNFDQGAAQAALRPAVEKAVSELLEQKDKLASIAPASASAQVVGVREKSVYIDKGANAGLTAGQRLEVFRVVDQIKDAQGNVLDEVTKKVGVLEISQVLSKSSVCAVVEGDAKVGDAVRSHASGAGGAKTKKP